MATYVIECEIYDPRPEPTRRFLETTLRENGRDRDINMSLSGFVDLIQEDVLGLWRFHLRAFRVRQRPHKIKFFNFQPEEKLNQLSHVKWGGGGGATRSDMKVDSDEIGNGKIGFCYFFSKST